MARRTTPEPTERELEILQFLWSAGSASLSEVCTELRRTRPVAATTVATLLKIMRSKRLVERTRQRRWRPLVTHQATTTGMLRRLIDRVFEGSAQRMVAQLLETGRLKPNDIAELQRLLDEHRTR